MTITIEAAKSLLSISLAALLIGCAGLGDKTVGPPLTGDEIKKLISGNTVQGPMGREMYDWYYQSDGAVTGVIGAADNDSGTWKIKDENVYCHTWDQYFDGVEECYLWFKQERSGRYLMRSVESDTSGDIPVWGIVEGNPYNM